MASSPDESLTISVAEDCRVSGLLRMPAQPRALLLLAHGAGAGMRHAFLVSVAAELAARDIATLRYQFPYMERRSRRPDPPDLCHATVRAAAATAAQLAPAVPLFAGGKSFGGRMTSQAQAGAPLAGVRGLAFLGFPLHPPGQPAETRAQHLFQVRIPILFLQGTRDEFADLRLLEPLVSRLGERATLHLFRDADHSFHVPASTGRKAPEVMRELTAALAAWIESLTGSEPE
jgi:predicted alpha/beta-hydrolase family hydrolase